MLLEELRQSRKSSANVAYMHFISLTKNNHKGYFCFFEGKDAPYYLPRIRSIYKGSIHPIKCGGKDNVIKVYRLIHNHKEYWKYRKGFFVDRDYEPKVFKSLSPPIYETPAYSIENFYSTINSFTDIIKCEFGLIEHEKEFKECAELYLKRQKEFHKSTLLFNAWYYNLKKTKEKKKLPSTNVNLSDKLPKSIIHFSLNKITSNYTIERLKELFPESINFTKKSLNETKRELRKSNHQSSFRGKYELEFLSFMIRSFLEDANNVKKRHILKKKVKFNFEYGLIVSQFSQYADTPNCLLKYIKETTSKTYKYKKSA